MDSIVSCSRPSLTIVKLMKQSPAQQSQVTHSLRGSAAWGAGGTAVLHAAGNVMTSSVVEQSSSLQSFMLHTAAQHVMTGAVFLMLGHCRPSSCSAACCRQCDGQLSPISLHNWSAGSRVRVSPIAANQLIGEVVQSRRRPLLGPSPG